MVSTVNTPLDKAGPDGSLVSTGACNLDVPCWNPNGPMFVIVVVHIQCSKQFKGMEYTVLPMVLFTIKNPWSYSK